MKKLMMSLPAEVLLEYDAWNVCPDASGVAGSSGASPTTGGDGDDEGSGGQQNQPQRCASGGQAGRAVHQESLRFGRPCVGCTKC